MQNRIPYLASDKQLVTLALLLILVIGLMDYFTGANISLTVFYILPIAFAAWFIGIGTGAVLALIATFVYLVGDIYSQGERSNVAISFWNASIRLSMFFVVLYCFAMLRKTQDQLKFSVMELESRNREILVLAQIGEILQSCSNAEEAYTVLQKFSPRVFESSAGSLAVFEESRKRLQVVVSWNEATPVLANFPGSDCWGLRRGRAHVVTKTEVTVICPHLHTEAPEDYICVPLLAQGETVGVLTVLDRSSSVTDEGQATNRETKRRLTFALAEQIALTLSNLKMRDRLQIQATRDPLTGLFNRRYFNDAFEKELQHATATGKSLSLILIDIDYFKRINDTFGHEAGDFVLRDVARLLQGQIGAEDFVCRYGGEEFIVVLADCTPEAAKEKAEDIRQMMKNRKIKYHNRILESITLSMAVGSSTSNSTLEALLRATDSALYRAKAEGRDRVITAS